MANGITALRKIQLGRQATPGNGVPATTVWRGTGLLEDKREVVNVAEQIGIATNTTRAYVPKLGAAVTLDPIEATFQQLPHILEMGITAATATADGAGTDFIYAYPICTTAIPVIKNYTVVGGDNQLAAVSWPGGKPR